MQQMAPQSVGRMLSWDKFEIYPRTGAVRQKYTYTALFTKNRNIAKRLPAGNQDGCQKSKNIEV